MMRIRLMSTFLALSTLVINPSAFGEVQHIKIGYIVGTPLTGLFVCVQKGYCKTSQFEIELVPFGGGGKNLQGVQSGAIQMGSASPIPFLYYLTRAQDIIAIVSESQGGTIEYLSGGLRPDRDILPQGFFAVRPDSDIKTVKDLRGKTVAGASDKGTWPDLYMRKLFKSEGIDPDRDLTYTTLGFDLMPGALANKTVDGAFMWEPAYTMAKQKYGVRVLFTDLTIEAMLTPPVDKDSPTGGGDLIFARRDWAEKNRAVLVSFLRQYKLSLDWMWRNYEEARVLGATGQGFSTEVGKSWVDSSGPRSGKFSVDALSRAHNLMIELGVLKEPIPGWPEKHIDYSYLDAAKIGE
jgi:ABC-type nitrate/sulfonate/bicarbonate transport system substrate-binding protein